MQPVKPKGGAAHGRGAVAKRKGATSAAGRHGDLAAALGVKAGLWGDRERLSLLHVPARRKEKVSQEFTGKRQRTEDGKIALNRKYGDQRAWDHRRRPDAAPPGGWPKPPSHWPAGIRVDLGKTVPWLPKGWGQGVKLTCVTKLLGFVSPQGTVYYHKHVVERVIGRKVTGDGIRAWDRRWEGVRAKWDAARVKENLDEVRAYVAEQIKAGKNFKDRVERFTGESRLFAGLIKEERKHLPATADALHFAVISARRADDARSLREVCNVQAQLVAGGAKPVWYVDKPSLKAYRKLGLSAKVGGKLVPARNLALRDAERLGKACVQLSDDIHRWDYCGGLRFQAADIFSGNEAAKQAGRLRISPAAAARFLLAKLRAANGPKLAGVFPLGNTGMAFAHEPESKECFILGDFFVADRSACRFDPRMSLKEDYDFTCSHLKNHGSVLRCNRMFVAAVHETNPGGAVSERDEAGQKERDNIAILRKKWPGVFHINGRRGDTQVVMCWRRRKTS